jgi:myosin heavy subunit
MSVVRLEAHDKGFSINLPNVDNDNYDDDISVISTSTRHRDPSRLAKTSRSSDTKNDNDSTTQVYIKDEAYSWLPAKILRFMDSKQDKVEVLLTLPKDWHKHTVLSEYSTIVELEEGTVSSMKRIVSRRDYPNGSLPLQNPSSIDGVSPGCRDMADLPYLHEAAILYNLKDRHCRQSQPYTRVGDIMVALNPFRWMPNLYEPATQELYAKLLIWNSEQSPLDTILGASMNNNSKGQISFNPLEECEDTTEEASITTARQYTKLGHDPHVYETSCLAYRGLLRQEGNQTILVTGESGAGKTETVKIVLQHLATLSEYYSKSEPHQNSNSISKGTVVQRVMESNPILEAFGNAKTVRNDNSSRFGKFTQLQFKLSLSTSSLQQGEQDMNSSTTTSVTIPPRLAGSICHTYLLEKSRVVWQSPGERNYHIFYQMLRASQEQKRDIWKELENADVTSFRYLVDSTQKPMGDEEEWSRTLEALAVFDYHGTRLQTLLRALCAILQIGNLIFVEDPASHETEEGGTIISSHEELAKLQDLLNIPMDDLEKCMTTRLLKTGYDEVYMRLSPSVAKDSADALAKEMYARIFDVLVKSINEYTQDFTKDPQNVHDNNGSNKDKEAVDDNQVGLICLLDIFGFERFQVNRFEQLCINYANEHLQNKYVTDNFRAVQEEYQSEGIEVFDFSMVDNSDVLSLLEDRLGILVSLNEECMRPKGNDESFVYKIKIVNKDHVRIIDEKLHRKTEFGIRHFAGPVKYDATKFVERNMDSLPNDLIECISQCSNEIISREFKLLLSASNSSKGGVLSPGRRKVASKSVIQKFRIQLQHLMSNIQSTTTRYIRCIKPNDNMIPNILDQYTTMRQLECAGLVTAITISRETFPNNLEYDTTRIRFECLLTRAEVIQYQTHKEEKLAADYLLSTLLRPLLEAQMRLQKDNAKGNKSEQRMRQLYACGNSRVYFRTGILEFLENKRLDYYNRSVVLIQGWVRKIFAAHKYTRMRTAAKRIQAIGRGYWHRRRYRRAKAASIRLVAWLRGRRATKKVQKMRMERAAVSIQSYWRTKSQAYQLSRMKKAAIVIQHALRNRGNREKFSAKLAIAVEEARMDTKLLGLKQEVAQNVTSQPNQGILGRQINRELLQEVELMFDYLRKEIFQLRQGNSELKSQVFYLDNEKRDLEIRVEAADAAVTSSRLQLADASKKRDSLSQNIDHYKNKVLSLKKQLKIMEMERQEESKSQRAEFDKAIREKQEELDEIKSRAIKTTKFYEQSLAQEQQKAAKVEEGYVTEIMRLKDELRQTQESHHDYLAKLMDVLETAHQSREQETARIASELLLVKEEKDSQINELKRELESLRRIKKGGSAYSVMSVPSLEGKIQELTAAQHALERNSSARRHRSQKFKEISSRLDESLSPENLINITTARRARGKSMSVLEEETIRMKKMIRFLNDLYSLEESSQSLIDNKLMKSMETYMAALDPDTAQMKMELQLQQLDSENKRLKEQVSAQGQCQRCDARDKRRLFRTRPRSIPSRDLESQDEDER